MFLDIDLDFAYGSPVYGARFLEWIGCVPSTATGEPYSGGRLHNGYGTNTAALYAAGGSDSICGFMTREVIASSVATVGQFKLQPVSGTVTMADLNEWSVLTRVQDGSLTGNGTTDVRYTDVTAYQFRIYVSGSDIAMELRKYVSGTATTLAITYVPGTALNALANATIGLAVSAIGSSSPVTVAAYAYYINPGSGSPSQSFLIHSYSDSSSPITADGRAGFTMGTYRNFLFGTGTDICKVVYCFDATETPLYRDNWTRNSSISLVSTSPSDGNITGKYLQGRFANDQFGGGLALARDTSAERVYLNLNSGATNNASTNISLRSATNPEIQHRRVQIELQNSAHTSLGAGVIVYASATSLATSTTGETGFTTLKGYAVYCKHTTSGSVYSIIVYRYNNAEVVRLAAYTETAPGSPIFPAGSTFTCAMEAYPTDQQGGYPDASVTLKVYIDGTQVVLESLTTTPIGVTVGSDGTIIDGSAGRITGGSGEGIVVSGATGGDLVYFDDWTQLTLHTADPGTDPPDDEQPTFSFGNEGTASVSLGTVVTPAWSVDVEYQTEAISVQFESGHRFSAPHMTDTNGDLYARRKWTMTSPPLTLAEREAVIAFYNARNGAEGAFNFIEPNGDTVKVHFSDWGIKTRKAAHGTYYVELLLEELI